MKPVKKHELLDRLTDCFEEMVAHGIARLDKGKDGRMQLTILDTGAVFDIGPDGLKRIK